MEFRNAATSSSLGRVLIDTPLTYAELVRQPGAIRIGFVTALAIQFWVLYVPRAPGVQSSLPLDKVVHVGLFAVVTWLGLRAGIPRAWVIGAMILQAGASELVQHYFLAQRGGDWWDFAADLAGVAIGLWLARTIDRPSSASRRRSPGR
jgi:hypothetical protein